MEKIKGKKEIRLILIALAVWGLLRVGMLAHCQQQTIEHLKLENGLLSTFNEAYKEDLAVFAKHGAYKQGRWDMWGEMMDAINECKYTPGCLPHCSARCRRDIERFLRPIEP